MNEIKTEVDGYYKVGNGVLLNKDNDSLAAYKAQKRRNKLISSLESKMQEMETKIISLEEELQQIKKQIDYK